MKKKILIIFCLFFILFEANSQSQPSAKQSLAISYKYLIKINNNVVYDIISVSDLIKKFSAAHSVSFNNTSGYFEVLTKHQLNDKVFKGKFQKNATPINEFIFEGTTYDSNPNVIITNTSSQ